MDWPRAVYASTGAERRSPRRSDRHDQRWQRAACFAAASGAQSRENEASCAGLRSKAVLAYAETAWTRKSPVVAGEQRCGETCRTLESKARAQQKKAPNDTT